MFSACISTALNDMSCADVVWFKLLANLREEIVLVMCWPVYLQVNMRPINDMEDELKQRRAYTRNTSNEAYDSDSEEEGGGRGGQRVQCAQQ